MSEELKPCPCGKIPEKLNIQHEGKWATATGHCCDKWAVEFRTGYQSPSSPEYRERAIEAWNEAPRHSPSDCARCSEKEQEIERLKHDVSRQKERIAELVKRAEKVRLALRERTVAWEDDTRSAFDKRCPPFTSQPAPQGESE